MIGVFIGGALGEPLDVPIDSSGALVAQTAGVTVRFEIRGGETILQREGPGGTFSRRRWERMERERRRKLREEEWRLERQLQEARQRVLDEHSARQAAALEQWWQQQQEELASLAPINAPPPGASLRSGQFAPLLAGAEEAALARRKQRDMAVAMLLLDV